MLVWGTRWGSWLKHCPYKPEVRGFDSRRSYWNFSVTQSFLPHYGPEFDSACNRNYYQQYFLGGKDSRCVRLTTLPPSCVDYLEIWKPLLLRTLRDFQDTGLIVIYCTGSYILDWNLYSGKVVIYWNVRFIPE
jgi:hypothetical protein